MNTIPYKNTKLDDRTKTVLFEEEGDMDGLSWLFGAKRYLCNKNFELLKVYQDANLSKVKSVFITQFDENNNSIEELAINVCTGLCMHHAKYQYKDNKLIGRDFWEYDDNGKLNKFETIAYNGSDYVERRFKESQ